MVKKILFSLMLFGFQWISAMLFAQNHITTTSTTDLTFKPNVGNYSLALLPKTVFDVQKESGPLQIKYSAPRAKSDYYTIGSILMGASLITAIVVAPLTSMDFSDGNIAIKNRRRFYTLLGAGILGFAVSIPISNIR